ncbi:pantothenate synthetase [gut metagenome]|uniref:pantoate--beta-alanine ligase (AMP-forming) n=1 Tax=gut metagenome TaxID=749906 RepID=J9FJ08_9ZZZZ
MKMIVISKVKELEKALGDCRTEGKTIGLVPTMGALHAGHASLVKRSVKENDVTVVSVFVNPTQFNDKNDLKNYPRTLEADCRLLEDLGAAIVFAPTVDEIYPEPDTRTFSYPPIDTVMEGGKRPGHFNGVCQIVSKLFYYTQPTRAYFGEKDFQQIAVIRAMVNDLKLDLELCPCPIVREESGLALSSRNTLLTEEEKNIAVNISRVLADSIDYAKTHTVEETQKQVVDELNSIDQLEVEYYQIVDGITLQPVASWEETDYIVGCITVYCGHRPVRLIDNIKYKG